MKHQINEIRRMQQLAGLLKESETLYNSEIYINIASKDHLTPLINKKCNNCDETIIKQIMIGDKGQSIYVCPKCNSKFI